MRQNSHTNSPKKFSTIEQLYCDDLLPSLPDKKHSTRMEEDLSRNNKGLFRFSSAEPVEKI